MFRGFFMRFLAGSIFLLIFAVLLIAWLIVWAGLHIVGGAIHLLLAFAIIALIIHFVRRARGTA